MIEKYKIYNEKFKELEGYLYFNTETQQFSMTILDDYSGKNPDWFFRELNKQGITEVPQHLVDMWVQERVFPPNRQGLQGMLADIGMAEYNLHDILVDVKLYANPCIDGGVYKYRNNFNQVTTYALAYASFIGSKEANKSSRKDISYTDVNAWILHFRKNITNREQGLNGKQLFDFSQVRVYNIDLSESKGIEYLDEQIKIFVNTYLVKEDNKLC